MGFDCIKGGCGASLLAMYNAKLFYLALGWVSLGLGAVGVIIPVMPTTPFLIVAVWAFSKSSPALAARIRNHRTFGPYIRDWQDRGVIPMQAKLLATTMMSAAGFYLAVWSPAPVWISAIAIAIMIVVAAYVLSRPSR